MQLREIMTLDVAVTRPDATLAEAAAQMKTLDVGLLPVCDGDYLVGMLTDRDITVRAAAAGSDPTTTLVVDTMTPDVVWHGVEAHRPDFSGTSRTLAPIPEAPSATASRNRPSSSWGTAPCSASRARPTGWESGRCTRAGLRTGGGPGPGRSR